MRRRQRKNRCGAATVEFAVCCPVVFILLLGTMVGALGVFRYQQTAELAREAARWACVHGGQYAEETGNPAASPQDIYDSVIEPLAMGMDRRRLTYEVTWDKSNVPLDASQSATSPKGNTVSVTVTYDWIPEVFWFGSYTLTSTSTAQMVY